MQFDPRKVVQGGAGKYPYIQYALVKRGDVLEEWGKL